MNGLHWYSNFITNGIDWQQLGTDEASYENDNSTPTKRYGNELWMKLKNDIENNKRIFEEKNERMN